MFGLGPLEMLIVGIIAVLLFGNRLPEVGRSLGKGLIEFKKGLRDIQNEVDISGTTAPSTRVSHQASLDEVDQATAPKFVPPVHEPTVQAEQHTVSAENTVHVENHSAGTPS
jgi:sec-independent protein translocase protein TatA